MLTHNTKLKSGVNFKTMSNKKQTSVDVLFETLWNTPKDKWEWNAALKEVREMHQKEIEEAYVDGQTISNGYSGASNYYNETFE